MLVVLHRHLTHNATLCKKQYMQIYVCICHRWNPVSTLSAVSQVLTVCVHSRWPSGLLPWTHGPLKVTLKPTCSADSIHPRNGSMSAWNITSIDLSIRHNIPMATNITTKHLSIGFSILLVTYSYLEVKCHLFKHNVFWINCNTYRQTDNWCQSNPQNAGKHLLAIRNTIYGEDFKKIFVINDLSKHTSCFNHWCIDL